MPTRLTKAQQRSLIRALPAHRKNAVKKHCQKCQMQGQGFKDILKSVSSVLGPIAKEVGPVVLKELVVPFLKNKAGLGLRLPGGALRLAGRQPVTRRRQCGTGKRKKKKKKGSGIGSVRI